MWRGAAHCVGLSRPRAVPLVGTGDYRLPRFIGKMNPGGLRENRTHPAPNCRRRMQVFHESGLMVEEPPGGLYRRAELVKHGVFMFVFGQSSPLRGAVVSRGGGR